MGNVDMKAIGGVQLDAELGSAITPKTLTAASPGIVGALGAGVQAVVLRLVIQNTDTVDRSVTIGDGTISKGPFVIGAGDVLSIGFWPTALAWWFTANTAIVATPSADDVLKVLDGQYMQG